MVDSEMKFKLIGFKIEKTFTNKTNYQKAIKDFNEFNKYLISNNFKLSFKEIDQLINDNRILKKSIRLVHDYNSARSNLLLNTGNNEFLTRAIMLFQTSLIRTERKEPKKEKITVSKRSINKEGMLEEIKKTSPEMQDYYKYVKDIKNTSIGKEKGLIQRIRKYNDEEAKRILIEPVLKLAFPAAYRNMQYFPEYSFEDLVQEANSFIAVALNYYDEEKNGSFYIYANYILKQKFKSMYSRRFIDKHIKEENLAKYKKEFFEENGRYPSVEEINTFLHNIRVFKDEEDTEELVIDDFENQEDELENVILKDDVDNLLNNSDLNERRKTVTKLRFGIGEDNSLTLEEIGERLTITRERTRQLESSSLITLRRVPSLDGLEEYMDNPEEAKKKASRFKHVFISMNDMNKLNRYSIEEIILSKPLNRLFRNSKSDIFSEEILNDMLTRLNHKELELIRKIYGESIYIVNDVTLSKEEEIMFFDELIPKMKGILDCLEAENEEKEEKEKEEKYQELIKQKGPLNVLLYRILEPYETRTFVIDKMINRLDKREKDYLRRILKSKNKKYADLDKESYLNNALIPWMVNIMERISQGLEKQEAFQKKKELKRKSSR